MTLKWQLALEFLRLAMKKQTEVRDLLEKFVQESTASYERVSFEFKQCLVICL